MSKKACKHTRGCFEDCIFIPASMTNCPHGFQIPLGTRAEPMDMYTIQGPWKSWQDVLTKRLTSTYFVVDLGFASETALEEYVTTGQNIFGAIVFLVSSNAESLPKKITYKVRLRSDKSLFHRRRKAEWKTNAMFPDFSKIEPREANDPFGGKEPGISAVDDKQLLI